MRHRQKIGGAASAKLIKIAKQRLDVGARTGIVEPAAISSSPATTHWLWLISRWLLAGLRSTPRAAVLEQAERAPGLRLLGRPGHY
jgi:hypothetical protein